MSTAVDSNVLIALWNEDDTLNTQARSALDTALGRGGLVIAAPVFAELLAAPSRTESFLDSFCKETGIAVDWNLNEATWRGAGRASNSTLLAAEGSVTPARATFLPIS
jgi:hypothetical protein